MKFYCTNGKVVSSYYIEKRGNEKYIIGTYTENGKTKKCYIGPLDPKYVFSSLPTAYIISPREWDSALRWSISNLIMNVENNKTMLDAIESTLRYLLLQVEQAKKKLEKG